MSQPELLFHEILHLREPLIGSLAFFIFVLNRRGPARKTTLYVLLTQAFIWQNLGKAKVISMFMA